MIIISNTLYLVLSQQFYSFSYLVQTYKLNRCGNFKVIYHLYEEILRESKDIINKQDNSIQKTTQIISNTLHLVLSKQFLSISYTYTQYKLTN